MATHGDGVCANGRERQGRIEGEPDSRGTHAGPQPAPENRKLDVLRINRLRLTPGAVIRMVADVILLQVALILALAARFYVVVNFEDLGGLTVSRAAVGVPDLVFQDHGAPHRPLFARSSTPPVSTLAGSPTRAATRCLVVIQAVSVSFLIYISAVLFFNVHDGRLSFAKAAMLLAWLFSILLLAGARVWNQIWQRAMRARAGTVSPAIGFAASRAGDWRGRLHRVGTGTALVGRGISESACSTS